MIALPETPEYSLAMLTAFCHSRASGWVRVEDTSKVSDLRSNAASLVWAEVDVEDLTPDDPKIIEEEFDLDPFAVEDALNPLQRPKLEAYESHFFAILHQLDEIDRQLEPRQISCFLGAGFVLVIHQGAGRILKETRARLRAVEREAVDSPRLLHVLIDALVDDYETIANGLEEELEDLEDEALQASAQRQTRRRARAAHPDQRRLYVLKQQASRLRRFALPLNRSLERIADGRSQMIPADSQGSYQDVLDHTLRITAQVQSIDYLVDAMLDLIRSEQAASLNETNKKLTAWAAIIATPTLISSIYGMNFLLIPRQQSLRGFLFAVALMVIAASTLYISFKRRGWL